MLSFAKIICSMVAEWVRVLVFDRMVSVTGIPN